MTNAIKIKERTNAIGIKERTNAIGIKQNTNAIGIKEMTNAIGTKKKDELCRCYKLQLWYIWRQESIFYIEIEKSR